MNAKASDRRAVGKFASLLGFDLVTATVTPDDRTRPPGRHGKHQPVGIDSIRDRQPQRSLLPSHALETGHLYPINELIGFEIYLDRF